MYYCPGNYWSFERLKGDLQNKLNTFKKNKTKENLKNVGIQITPLTLYKKYKEKRKSKKISNKKCIFFPYLNVT